MSRFVRPEMEVIRFNEEDVIVASGSVVNTFTTHNFFDGTTGDGWIEFNGKTYGNSRSDAEFNGAKLLALLTPEQKAATIMELEGDGAFGGYGNIEFMFNSEASDDSKKIIKDFNGTFEYDSTYGDSGAWIRLVQ